MIYKQSTQLSTFSNVKLTTGVFHNSLTESPFFYQYVLYRLLLDSKTDKTKKIGMNQFNVYDASTAIRDVKMNGLSRSNFGSDVTIALGNRAFGETQLTNKSNQNISFSDSNTESNPGKQKAFLRAKPVPSLKADGPKGPNSAAASLQVERIDLENKKLNKLLQMKFNTFSYVSDGLMNDSMASPEPSRGLAASVRRNSNKKVTSQLVGLNFGANFFPYRKSFLCYWLLPLVGFVYAISPPSQGKNLMLGKGEALVQFSEFRHNQNRYSSDILAQKYVSMMPKRSPKAPLATDIKDYCTLYLSTLTNYIDNLDNDKHTFLLNLNINHIKIKNSKEIFGNIFVKDTFGALGSLGNEMEKNPTFKVTQFTDKNSRAPKADGPLGPNSAKNKTTFHFFNANLSSLNSSVEFSNPMKFEDSQTHLSFNSSSSKDVTENLTGSLGEKLFGFPEKVSLLATSLKEMARPFDDAPQARLPKAIRIQKNVWNDTSSVGTDGTEGPNSAAKRKLNGISFNPVYSYVKASTVLDAFNKKQLLNQISSRKVQTYSKQGFVNHLKDVKLTSAQLTSYFDLYNIYKLQNFEFYNPYGTSVGMSKVANSKEKSLSQTNTQLSSILTALLKREVNTDPSLTRTGYSNTPNSLMQTNSNWTSVSNKSQGSIQNVSKERLYQLLVNSLKQVSFSAQTTFPPKVSSPAKGAFGVGTDGPEGPNSAVNGSFELSQNLETGAQSESLRSKTESHKNEIEVSRFGAANQNGLDDKMRGHIDALRASLSYPKRLNNIKITVKDYDHTQLPIKIQKYSHPLLMSQVGIQMNPKDLNFSAVGLTFGDKSKTLDYQIENFIDSQHLKTTSFTGLENVKSSYSQNLTKASLFTSFTDQGLTSQTAKVYNESSLNDYFNFSKFINVYSSKMKDYLIYSRFSQLNVNLTSAQGKDLVGELPSHGTWYDCLGNSTGLNNAPFTSKIEKLLRSYFSIKNSSKFAYSNDGKSLLSFNVNRKKNSNKNVSSLTDDNQNSSKVRTLVQNKEYINLLKTNLMNKLVLSQYKPESNTKRLNEANVKSKKRNDYQGNPATRNNSKAKTQIVLTNWNNISSTQTSKTMNILPFTDKMNILPFTDKMKKTSAFPDIKNHWKSVKTRMQWSKQIQLNQHLPTKARLPKAIVRPAAVAELNFIQLKLTPLKNNRNLQSNLLANSMAQRTYLSQRLLGNNRLSLSAKYMKKLRSQFVSVDSNWQEHADDVKLGKNFITKKHLQKKRRIKKLKKETRQRKKRKRFFPRPIWIRYRLYSNFLKNRYYNQALPTTMSSRPFRQSYINVQPNLNTSVVSLMSPTSTNEYYTISRPVLGELKRVLWKSYWLRSNLNPYLSKVKSSLKKVKQSKQSWELYQNVNRLICECLGFTHSGYENLNTVNHSNLALNTLSGTRQLLSAKHVSLANLYLLSEKNNVFRETKFQTAINLSEYNRLSYDRLQQFISQIRENLTLSGNIKIRSSHVGHYPFKDKRGLNLKKNGTQGQSDFWVKLGKTLTFETQQSSVVQATSKVRLYWAFSKTSNSFFKEITSQKQKWETTKKREQTKNNKTKKLFRNLLIQLELFTSPRFPISPRIDTENLLSSMKFNARTPFKSQIELNSLFDDGRDLQSQNEDSLTHSSARESKNIDKLFQKALLKTRQKQEKASILTAGTIDTNQMSDNVKEKKMYVIQKILGHVNMDKSSEGRALRTIPFTAGGPTFSELGPKGPSAFGGKRENIKKHLTTKSAYWWVETVAIPSEMKSTNSDVNSFFNFLKRFGNTDTIYSSEMNSFSTPNSGQKQSADKKDNMILLISALLFHFCIILSILSVSQIRGFFKFTLLAISKVYKTIINIFLGDGLRLKNSGRMSSQFFSLTGFNLRTPVVLNPTVERNKFRSNQNSNEFPRKLTRNTTYSNLELKNVISLNSIKTALMVRGQKPAYDEEYKSRMAADEQKLTRQIFKSHRNVLIFKSLLYTKGMTLFDSSFLLSHDKLQSQTQLDVLRNNDFQKPLVAKELSSYFKYLTISRIDNRNFSLFNINNSKSFAVTGETQADQTKGEESGQKLSMFKAPQMSPFTLLTQKIYLLLRYAMKKPVYYFKLIFSNSKDVTKRSPTNIHLSKFNEVKLTSSPRTQSISNKAKDVNFQMTTNTTQEKRYSASTYYIAKGTLQSLLIMNYLVQNSYNAYTQTAMVFKDIKVNVFEKCLRSIYTFLEKPGEQIGDWIAYMFLVEWASDISNTIPENLDIYLGATTTKLSRTFFFDNLNFQLVLSNFVLMNSMVNTKQISNLSLFNLPADSLKQNYLLDVIKDSTAEGSGGKRFSVNLEGGFSLLNIASPLLQRRIYHLYELLLFQFYQPDTDLIIRQKKGILFWDIWGDFLTQTAEDSNINISELTSVKEEQIKLLETCEISLSPSPQTSVFSTKADGPLGPNSASSKKLFVNNPKSTLFQKKFSQTDVKPITSGESQSAPERALAVKSLSKGSNNVSHLSTLINSFSNVSFGNLNQNDFVQMEKLRIQLRHQNGDNTINHLVQTYSPIELIQTNALNSSNETALLKAFSSANYSFNHLKFGDLGDTRIGWGAQQFLSYQGKDTELFIDLHPRASLDMVSLLRSNESVQQPLGTLICQIYSGLLSRQISKNILVVGSAGIEKTLLVQAIAGETELKIITDNAYRYAMVYRGVAVGIKLLRDVFDSLVATGPPCLFLIEDIHAIGEKRPLLISDDENLSKKDGTSQEIHEKNQVFYQLSKHVITHYKKPYKGDFSLLIPSNHFCFDLFLAGANNYSNPTGGIAKQKSSRPNKQIPVPKIALNKETNLESNMTHAQNTPLAEGAFGAPSKSFSIYKNLPSRLLIKSSELLSPPASSPFSFLTLVDSKKFKPAKTVSEMPWAGLPGEQLAQVSKASYSIRVKVALLADMAISSLSVKLDMITDLLVIIDSVKGNRGFVIFATTHIPYILDPALRRPGRLDETISLGLAPTVFSRWEILKSSFAQMNTAVNPLGVSGSLVQNTIDFSYFNKNFSTQYSIPQIQAKLFNYISTRQTDLVQTGKYSNALTGPGAPKPRAGGPLGPNSAATKKSFVLNKNISSIFMTQAPAISSLSNVQKFVELRARGAFGVKQKPDLNIFDLNATTLKVPRLKSITDKTSRKSLSQAYFSASVLLTTNVKTFELETKTRMGLKAESGTADGPKDLTSAKTSEYFELTPNFFNENSRIINIYGSPKQLKDHLVFLISGKLGEMFLFSKTSQLKEIKDLTKRRNAVPLGNILNKNVLGAQSPGVYTSVGLSNTWQALTSLLLSFIHKRYIYHKNLIVPKLLSFTNYSSLMEYPSPPATNILLPARRYENYKRSFSYFGLKRKTSISIMDKINLHQQQRLVKRLYRYPVQEFFKSEILENRFTTFTNASLMIGPYDAISGKPTSSNWFVKNRILMRHKNSLTNHWWNGQLPEHNAETTFLSDIDWRYTFIQDSKASTAKGLKTSNDTKLMKDILLDLPDADQHYNPRQRRWILTKGSYQTWFDFDKTIYSEIYSHFIFESFVKAYNAFEQNRDILDFYSFYMLKSPTTSKRTESIVKLYQRMFSS